MIKVQGARFKVTGGYVVKWFGAIFLSLLGIHIILENISDLRTMENKNFEVIYAKST